MTRISGRRTSLSEEGALLFVPRFTVVRMWLIEVIVDPLFGIDAVSNSISELSFPALWANHLPLINETIGIQTVFSVLIIQLESILS